MAIKLVSRSLALDVVRMALEAMRANKLRSFLTVLGVIIGVATVIGMGAMVQGLDRSMSQQIRSFGSHVLWVRPYSQNGPHNGQLPDSLLNRHAFTEEDMLAIRDLCPSVHWVCPLTDASNPRIRYGHGKAVRSEVMGTNQDYFQISGLGIDRGRSFTESETAHSSQVCLIGQDLLESLFPHEGSVGKTIHINDIPFVVVGEIAHRGKMLGRSNDNLIIIPFTTLSKFFGDSMDPPRRGEMALKVKPYEEKVDQATGEITEVLRRRRHLRAQQPDNFVIETDDGLLNLYHQLTAGFYIVMMAISSIALMVGGIGVMNIMLVSVKERTREIGVRKAMGARRNDILGQFLLEAATLTGAGGAIGILLGMAVSLLVSVATPLPSHVAPWTIGVGLAFSVSIGLFFGIYPAYRAARLDPIEALRYE